MHRLGEAGSDRLGSGQPVLSLEVIEPLPQVQCVGIRCAERSPRKSSFTRTAVVSPRFVDQAARQRGEGRGIQLLPQPAAKRFCDEQVALVEAYAREQGMWLEPGPDQPEARYSEYLELDLSTVVPSIAGPKRPQGRIALTDARSAFRKVLPTYVSHREGDAGAATSFPASDPSPQGSPDGLNGGDAPVEEGDGDGEQVVEAAGPAAVDIRDWRDRQPDGEALIAFVRGEAAATWMTTLPDAADLAGVLVTAAGAVTTVP